MGTIDPQTGRMVHTNSPDATITVDELIKDYLYVRDPEGVERAKTWLGHGPDALYTEAEAQEFDVEWSEWGRSESLRLEDGDPLPDHFPAEQMPGNYHLGGDLKR